MIYWHSIWPAWRIGAIVHEEEEKGDINLYKLIDNNILN